jgi:hypothetical protein
MRWTMVLPIAVIGLAAASCLAISRRGQAAAAAAQPQPAGAASSSPGQSPGSPSSAGS